MLDVTVAYMPRADAVAVIFNGNATLLPREDARLLIDRLNEAMTIAERKHPIQENLPS